MSPPSKTPLRRAIVPCLLLLVLIGVIALLLHLQGDADPVTPRDADPRPKEEEPAGGGERPAWLSEPEAALVDTSRAAIRNADGVAAEEIAALRRLVPEDPDRTIAFLRYLRPEIDLAIRSDDADAGGAALEVLATAIRRGGDAVLAYISSPSYRPIHERSRSSDSEVLRARGTRFLGQLSGPTVLSGAIGMLDDESPLVRSAAIEIYGSHCAANGTARLKSIYMGEPDAGVRTAILMTIGKRKTLRGRDAFDIEKRALAKGTTAEMLQAIENITLYRDNDAAVEIAATLKSNSIQVQRTALETLLRLRDVRTLEAVEELVEREGIDEGVLGMAMRVVRILSGK